ncbi:hypothetical protein [Dysosmobacter sp.]|uniref:hypothetical protein n=1 Tax=Dysosmobacter sp. TaxID=2591382 RepID=UPI003AB1B331
MKKLFAFLMAAMLLALCACSGADTSAPANDSNAPQGDDSSGDAAEVQYDYQLKAGETTEVYDVTFDEMVTVTVDPASTRDGSIDLRSGIYFDNCTFNGGLTILGDYHAMVSLGGGCSFGEGSVVTCKEVTSGAGEDMGLEDNFVKVFVSCEGVAVETEYAVGVVTDGPDVTFNGTVYSKQELAPDTALLGVYSMCENDGMSYMKLAIGEDDSIEVLD